MAATSALTFAENIRRAVVGMLVPRADEDCSPQKGVNFCEMPAVSSKKVTWIIVGVVVGLFVFATAGILLFLHFRRQKQDKREDLEDRYQMSDYGLDEVPAARKTRADDGLKSHDGSPNPQGRRSRDPLHAGTEPKFHPGQLNGHLTPFDDGSSKAPSGNAAWPKRESSQQKPEV
ncbi:hypothetical protein C8A00DRAFT_41767 [Chaetomidium leptoderma]|uniref:Epidermal growth factor receptor-like transmembrane-juxtamembrane segment domain-containing protein n=1 Tax=Chaetomidium leptoderma TaxID=669021 RepID=A0AAN6VPZ5_9PEZI|nr:hypothetical protein C8A00DRAFT_41767 [Chaetomidium leptoderma]